jgi:hypothetical protein
MDIRDKKIKMPVWYLMEPLMKRLRQSSMPERSRSIEVEALGRDEWLNIRHVDFFGRDRHVVIRLQVHPINRGCVENAGEAQRRVRRDPSSALNQPLDPCPRYVQPPRKRDCSHIQGIKIKLFQDFTWMHWFFKRIRPV